MQTPPFECGLTFRSCEQAQGLIVVTGNRNSSYKQIVPVDIKGKKPRAEKMSVHNEWSDPGRLSGFFFFFLPPQQWWQRGMCCVLSSTSPQFITLALSHGAKSQTPALDRRLPEATQSTALFTSKKRTEYHTLCVPSWQCFRPCCTFARKTNEATLQARPCIGLRAPRQHLHREQQPQQKPREVGAAAKCIIFLASYDFH